MPEGPLVRKFHHLISPFVGQQVVKTGGSSKKLQPASLLSLWLQDTQVHGKKLFLRFDPDEEMEAPGSSPLPEPPQKKRRRKGLRTQSRPGSPAGRRRLMDPHSLQSSTPRERMNLSVWRETPLQEMLGSGCVSALVCLAAFG